MILLVVHDIPLDDGVRKPWFVGLDAQVGRSLAIAFAQRDGVKLSGAALFARLSKSDVVEILRAGYRVLEHMQSGLRKRAS